MQQLTRVFATRGGFLAQCYSLHSVDFQSFDDVTRDILRRAGHSAPKGKAISHTCLLRSALEDFANSSEPLALSQQERSDLLENIVRYPSFDEITECHVGTLRLSTGGFLLLAGALRWRLRTGDSKVRPVHLLLAALECLDPLSTQLRSLLRPIPHLEQAIEMRKSRDWTSANKDPAVRFYALSPEDVTLAIDGGNRIHYLFKGTLSTACFTLLAFSGLKPVHLLALLVLAIASAAGFFCVHSLLLACTGWNLGAIWNWLTIGAATGFLALPMLAILALVWMKISDFFSSEPPLPIPMRGSEKASHSYRLLISGRGTIWVCEEFDMVANARRRVPVGVVARQWLTLAVLLTLGMQGCAEAQTTSPQPKKADNPARRATAVRLLKQAGPLLGTERDFTTDAAYGAIANTQAALGDVAAARKTVEEIGYWQLRLFALTDIAEIQTNAGDQIGAKETLRAAEAVKMPAKQGPFDAIGRTQAKMGDFVAAEASARRIEARADQALVLSWAGFARARSGDRVGARADFGAARKAIQDEPFPNWGYKDIARLEWRAGELESARQTLLREKDKGAIAFAWQRIIEEEATVDAASARAAAVDARAAIEAMVPSTQQEISLHAWTAGKMSLDLARAGDLKTARELWPIALKDAEAIEDDSSRAHSLSMVGLAQRATGAEEVSRETMRKAFAAAEKAVGDHPTEFVWWTMAFDQELAGDSANAEKSIAQALKQGGGPDVECFAGPVAMAQTMTEGVQAKLDWIGQLKGDREKGLTYAEAAMGLVVDER